MRARLFFPVVLFLLVWTGCSSRPGEDAAVVTGERPIVLWKKNQMRVASDLNVWSGFRRNGGDWVAEGTNPTFCFFLRSGPPSGDLILEYSKKTPGTVQLRVNHKVQFFLEPTEGFRKIRRQITQLRNGINFVLFAGSTEGLVVRALFIGRDDEKEYPLLRQNDGFHLALQPGDIRLRFSGRFSISVNMLFFDPRGNVSSRHAATISRRFPFGSREFVFHSPTPFLLKMKCLAGSAIIRKIKYVPASAEPLPDKRLMRPSEAGKKIKNIFIFLADGCQAGHLALYGYGRNTGKSVSLFARDAVVFRNAYTAATFTAASVASMLAGRGPDRIGFVFFDNDVKLKKIGENLLLLPEFLKTKGYITSIFSPNPNLIPFFGFNQGVDLFAVMYGTWIHNESPKLVQAFSYWVEKNRSPRFSYVHFMEPHFPIIPPPPFANQYKRRIRPQEQTVIRNLGGKKTFTGEEVQDVIDDYDSAINYADFLFGKAIDFLKRNDLYRESLIVFASDHGQALFEHGVWGHGWNAFEETAHIPLVIKFPDSFHWRGENRDIVQLTDLFPTIYELLEGQKGPFDSTGLAGLLEGRENGDNRMAMVTAFASEATYGLRWRKWYYLLSLNTMEDRLYDLEGDPRESVVVAHPDVAQFLQGALLSRLRWQQREAEKGVAVDLKSIPREEYDRLKSLGYL